MAHFIPRLRFGLVFGLVFGLMWLVALAAIGTTAAAPDEPAAKPAQEKRTAQVIRISLPINPQTFSSVQQSIRRALSKAQKASARPVLIFEFVVPGGGKSEDASRGSLYGASRDLADYLTRSEMNRATTVAYLPKPIKGHAVLVALACEQIIMAPDATIGSAGIDIEGETPDADVVKGYETIARRRRTVPAAIALGMLDKRVQVLKVKTEASTEYATSEQLKELREKHTIESTKEVKRAGEWGQFTAADARTWGFVSLLARDRREVARGLELPPEAIEEDPLQGGSWIAMRVDLKGPMTADKANQVQRLIEDQVRDRHVNLVVIWLDSPGGSLDSSAQLASFLAYDERLNPGRVLTVAYIPNEARSDAALVAMACDQVVMQPKAVLGGPGAVELSDQQIRDIRESTIRKSLAERKMRSWSLWAAMFDPRLTVYRCSRLGGEVEYLGDDELQELNDKAGADKWTKGDPVTVPGRAFSVDGTQAVDYRLANFTVDNLAQLKQYYGLENDPSLVEPGWADFLIEALRSPGVAILLLIIGGAALYIELHVPGIGIGGFVAAVCFLLFFWSNYLGGTAGWLQVVLFLAGISCLLLEVFVVPGTAIFGLGGAALVLASLVLASQTFVWPQNEYQTAQMQRSLLTIGAAVGGLAITVTVLRHWLPHAPIFGRVFLHPPDSEEAEIISRREMLVDFQNLVGVHGATTTPLGPGGKARFGNTLVDVIADGEFIPRGSEIVVVAVHGNRVVVKAARES